MSGYLPCTDTLSMSRHISTLNYLRSAAVCLTRTRTVMCWLSVPGITDSANKCRVFGGRFNQKSLVTDEQYVTSSRVINHMIAANQPLHWLRLFYDTTSEKSHLLVFQLAMSKNRTILPPWPTLNTSFRVL